MSEKPILFSTPMVQAILDGRKTVTRRVVKPQPEVFIKICKEGVFYGNNLTEWNDVEGNTELAKQRLYGRSGRQYLFKDTFRRIWDEKIYGVVSLSNAQNKEGLSLGFYLPSREEENSVCTPINVCGIPRGKEARHASQTFGRGCGQQFPSKSKMGDREGKLGGQKKARECDCWGETSNVKIEQRTTDRDKAIVIHGKNPKGNSTKIQCLTGYDLVGLKQNYNIGQTIWVRETWVEMYEAYFYKADIPESIAALMDVNGAAWRPSIFMPKEAARIWLEVTNVRVERLREITEEDARAEGIIDGGCLNCGESEPCGCYNPQPDARDAFIYLWRSINEKRGYGWDTNPWVWVVEFKVVE